MYLVCGLLSWFCLTDAGVLECIGVGILEMFSCRWGVFNLKRSIVSWNVIFTHYNNKLWKLHKPYPPHFFHFYLFKEYLKFLNRLYTIWPGLGQFTLNKPRSGLWKEYCTKPGYTSITCSKFFTTKFNDSLISITIISCDYLNLSLVDEYVGDVTIPTQVIKYNQNFLQADQPIRLQYSNQIKLF